MAILGDNLNLGPLGMMGLSILGNAYGPNSRNAIGQGALQGLLMHQQMQGAATRQQRDDAIFKRQQSEMDRQDKLRADLGALDPTAPDYFDQAGKVLAGAGDFAGAISAKKLSQPMRTTWGVNPVLTDQGYVQMSETGEIRLLPFKAAPSFRFVPGDDYRQPMVFDSKRGMAMPAQLPAADRPTEPVDTMAPWRALPPKRADQMRERVYSLESKKLDDMREQVGKGRSIMQDLARFGELNRQQGTGGLLDRITALPTFDSEKREMEAIAARLAPAVRPAGSGATSDRDMALYLQSLPGVDKPGDVNKNIRDQYGRNLSGAEEKLAFAERYLTERGHLNGLEEAWKARRDGGDAKPAGQAGMAQPMQPPKGAVNLLRMNPKLREQFDAKYGQGAAAQVLGN